MLTVDAAINSSRKLVLAKEKDALFQDKTDFVNVLGNDTIAEILDAKVSPSEASYDLIKKQKYVEISAYNQFVTVEQARENLLETKDRYSESVKNYKNARVNYDIGYIDQTTFDLMKFQYDLQRIIQI